MVLSLDLHRKSQDCFSADIAWCHFRSTSSPWRTTRARSFLHLPAVTVLVLTRLQPTVRDRWFVKWVWLRNGHEMILVCSSELNEVLLHLTRPLLSCAFLITDGISPNLSFLFDLHKFLQAIMHKYIKGYWHCQEMSRLIFLVFRHILGLWGYFVIVVLGLGFF